MKKTILGLIALATISFGSDFNFDLNSAKSLEEGKNTYQKMAKYKLYEFEKGGVEKSKLISISQWYTHIINSSGSFEDQINKDFEYFRKEKGGVVGVVNRNGVVIVRTKQGFYAQAFESKEAYEKTNLYNVSENINYTYDNSTSTCVKATDFYKKTLKELCLSLSGTFNDYKINGDKIQIIYYQSKPNNWLSFNFYKTKSVCKADN